MATPGGFKEDWAEHFRGYEVRAFYHNDKGGEQHREKVKKLLNGVASDLRLLKWPDDSPNDINDLIRLPEFKGKSVLGWLTERCFKVTTEPKLAWCHGWNRKSEDFEVIDWVWPNHLRCGSYCSFSGCGGTMKSTIARNLTALFTRGKPMPGCDKIGLPPGHIIYVTAEDSEATVWTDLERNKANTKLVTVLPAILKDGDPMNILEHLGELRLTIREHGTRFVIIDGQNSVVGAPCIATDMLARNNVTNKLHQFAQQENLCLLGIRNEDKDGRAYGPASMSDLGRCVMRTVVLGEHEGQRYYQLEFIKVNDVSPLLYPPIPYSVEDLGGSARKILWGKQKPELTAQQIEDIEAHLKRTKPGDTPFEAKCRKKGLI